MLNTRSVDNYDHLKGFVFKGFVEIDNVVDGHKQHWPGFWPQMLNVIATDEFLVFHPGKKGALLGKRFQAFLILPG